MLRSLLKRPGCSGVVIVTRALGLGATFGVFSVANAVLFGPLPYPNADRIVVLGTLAEMRRDALLGQVPAGLHELLVAEGRRRSARKSGLQE